MSERHDPTPAALYARVSSDRQDVDLSVSAQLRALRDYADKNGYLVARTYVDEAESGRIADRPEFRKMIDEAAKPNAPFREILVWKVSRFTRKREHAVAFKSMLRRKGVRVVSITEHADDTPTGKLMEAIIESVDEFYSENLAQEVVRGMRESASRGSRPVKWCKRERVWRKRDHRVILSGQTTSSRKGGQRWSRKGWTCWSYCTRGEWTVTWTSYGRL